MLVWSFNFGFVTNSSSVIHYFDKKVFDDPEVKAFMEKYELKDILPADVWCRSTCHCLITEEDTFDKVNEDLIRSYSDDDYYRNYLEGYDPNKAIIIYGDEYDSIYHDLSNIIGDACKRLNLASHTTDYN